MSLEKGERMKSILFALLLIGALCEVKKENGILVLDDSNFKTVTKQYENMFVDFYSTVRFCCAHSLQRAPRSLEFISTLEKIVKDFEAKGKEVIIGKVDSRSPFNGRLTTRRIPKSPTSTGLADSPSSTTSRRAIPPTTMAS